MVLVFIAATFFIVMSFGRAYRAGFDNGVEQGCLYALRDFAEGHVWVEDGKLHFDESRMGFFNEKSGEQLAELDLEELRFEEE